jgi:hypothetical protein
MTEGKKIVKNRFIEDDPESLEWFSSNITEEERERAEEELKELIAE